MPKGTPIKCLTCKHWTNEQGSRSLDGGRPLLGTCNQPRRYEDFARTVRYRTGHGSDAFFAGMEEALKNSGPLLQSYGPEQVFLRTPATFSCAAYEGKPVPVEVA